MRRAIREHAVPFAVIVAFAALSVALGAYTLSQQRLQLPWTPSYTVLVDFDEVPGLAPGLGQPATVAGVEVGQITRARVVDGRARVTLTIERDKLARVHADATARLLPNTPLQDLQVELDPGSRAAGTLAGGDAIAVARTDVPIGSDQFLSALDTDNQRYLEGLLTAAGIGLDGRGPDLRALLAATGPTAEQVAELGAALAARRRALARTVHSLSVLAVAAGERDEELRQVVRGGAATLEAMASEDRALRAALGELPRTLRAARGGLDAAGDLADELGPAATALRPVARDLPAALRATRTLASTAVPSLRDRLRPAVRATAPALADVPAAARDLTRVTPDLENAFKVLEYAVNELFWTDGGRERGYPFWFAWAQHNANSVLSTGDAHGAVVRSALIFSCSTFQAVPQLQPALDGITTVLADACPAIGDEG